MTRQPPPISAYHLARKAGDPAAARAALVLAGQSATTQVEAVLLKAVEAFQAGSVHLAFLHAASASEAFPARIDCTQLAAKAAERQGRPDAVRRILASARTEVARARAAPQPSIPFPSPSEAQDDVVDVLVPVFKGHAQTMECVHSVLQHAGANRTSHRVLVLDDCSPDAALSDDLRRLAGTGAIDYVRRPVNLGFIKNMNQGMEAHPWRDVVWLNADTRVHGNWLDRLRSAAYASQRIACATPLSNNGELMGFPESRVRHPMPDAATQASIDQLADSAATHNHVVMEVGCGFCMFIKREALRDTGYLDEAGLVRGYGEDTDWCLRARGRGWQHVAATRLFVAHEGNASFGAEKSMLVRQNNAVLRHRYPGAESRFGQAVLSDPLGETRRRLQRARLASLGDWIAGRPDCAPGAPADQAQACRLHLLAKPQAGAQDGPAPELSLQYRNDGQTATVSLVAAMPFLPLLIDYRFPDDVSRLEQDLRVLPVQALVFHGLGGCPQQLLSLPSLLGVPYGVRCLDDSLLQPGMAAFAAAALFVQLPWQALVPRYASALAASARIVTVPSKAPDTIQLTSNAMACVLIADTLDTPAVAQRWLAVARRLARRQSGLVLLLDQASPWEKQLLDSQAVSRLPYLPVLGAADVLALCGCTAVVSLDEDPGAGWAAPARASRMGLPLYAPGSAVATQAGAWPLNALPGLQAALDMPTP